MFITDFPKLWEITQAYPILANNVRMSQSGQCPTEIGLAYDTIYNRYKYYRIFTDEEGEFFEALQFRLNRWYGKYKPIFDVINTINGFKKTVEWDIDKTLNSVTNNQEDTKGSIESTRDGSDDTFVGSRTGYNGNTTTVETPIGKHTVTKEFGNGVNSTVLGESDTALGATDTNEYGQTRTDTGFNNRMDETQGTTQGTTHNTGTDTTSGHNEGRTVGNATTDIDQDITTTDTEKTLAMMYKRYGINSFGEELLLIVSDLFLGVY